MQRQKHRDIEWLEFDLLNDIPRLKHGVFLRHGGSSQGSFNSLNTSFYVGDQQEDVKANLERIKDFFSHSIPSWENFVYGKANHGKAIKVVENALTQEVSEFDGLVTATPGISLMMKHADCQIGLFYDPIHHVTANIHAGWRGSVANIYAEAIQSMRKTFGSHPSDILVCISPSLGPDEAEFIHYRSELPEEFWHFQVRPNFFDFWSISEYQLQSAGILPHHIEVARLSTYSNSHDFFSYRRDKMTGRHSTWITLL